MIYLLDTSILIELLRVKPETKDFVDSHDEDTILTSSICEAEVYEEVYREKPENISAKQKTFKNLLENFAGTVSFDSNQANIAGKTRAELSKKGSLIGDLDVLIAAATISQNATLVTKNLNHFQKIPGLQVIGL